jgi:molecular chaperone GrpE
LSVSPEKSDVATLMKGMQIVHDQWLAELAKQSVLVFAPKVGDTFDPNTMQALMQQPSDLPENQVTQLLQKGYTLHERTLRPAQVAVSKGK